MTTYYLSRTEVAELIGMNPSSLSRVSMPEPDAVIGDVRGWLLGTIKAWDRTRPRRGYRTDLYGRPDQVFPIDEELFQTRG